jgi:ribosome-associated translation inhibitor RaiA
MSFPTRQARAPVRAAASSRQPRPVAAEPEEEDLHNSIDPILDKISRSGIASLTARERERLEKARHKLIAKDGGA